MLNQRNKYNPDVLDCIANLSNDEVFTSPRLANEMLDMLPQDIFFDPNTTYLDVASKSGVFLREIVKRLDKGLETKIPDKQERIDHILHKQVFGIAITELTALLSRRTVYCSKYACEIDENDDSSLWEGEDGRVYLAHSYSISQFTNADANGFCLNPIQGNIRYNPNCRHEYKSGTVCACCGANKKDYGEKSHAYELLHTEKMNKKFWEELQTVEWTLIVANPPYQLSDSSLSASAMPIYNKFVTQTEKLEPRYLSMIIPSRWMAGGGKALMSSEKRCLMINILQSFTTM